MQTCLLYHNDTVQYIYLLKIQETEKHSDGNGRFGDLVKVLQEIERHLDLPESFSGEIDVNDDDGGNHDEDDEDYLKFAGNYGTLWSL